MLCFNHPDPRVLEKPWDLSSRKDLRVFQELGGLNPLPLALGTY